LAAPVPLHNLASAIDLRFGDDEGQARSVVVCLRIPYLIMVCLFPWLTILARSKSVIAAELVTLRHDEQDGPPLKQQGRRRPSRWRGCRVLGRSGTVARWIVAAGRVVDAGSRKDQPHGAECNRVTEPGKFTVDPPVARFGTGEDR
jgi:hypothetical protein